MDVPEIQPHAPDRDLVDLEPQPRWQTLSLVLAIVWTLAIMIVCWLPREAVHRIERDGAFFVYPNGDKLIHCGIFAVYVVLWLRAVSARWRLSMIGVTGLVLALLTEVVQEIPAIHRDAALGDMLADSIGVGLGIIIKPIVDPWMSRWEARVRKVFVARGWISERGAVLDGDR